ncbi:5'/3'-nucleotidase SurE [Halobaculum sp. MBLA0147]|uniref:5'/3'-nucleotidase SurE n=1 Tax=Halobaculum sp. MBLA0147 TaxID=3079934 RepID=UPI003525D384
MTSVLLTNDDGVESPGLAALYEELRAVADVTVVAPAEDHSGVGRARSRSVAVDDHEWGYVVDGTPADCVAYGVDGLDTAFDLVVSGCNLGPNCGAYVMGHSGTVGAVVEGAFLGVPGVAVSGYHREELFPPEGFTYHVPATATRRLVEHGTDRGVFDHVDYLSVNVPVETEATYRVTRPLADYAVAAESTATEAGSDGGEAADASAADDGGDAAASDESDRQDASAPADDVRLANDYWAVVSREERFPTPADTEANYPPWSDRAAVVDGEIAVSPLHTPQRPAQVSVVDELVAVCNDAR